MRTQARTAALSGGVIMGLVGKLKSAYFVLQLTLQLHLH